MMILAPGQRTRAACALVRRKHLSSAQESDTPSKGGKGIGFEHTERLAPRLRELPQKPVAGWPQVMRWATVMLQGHQSAAQRGVNGLSYSGRRALWYSLGATVTTLGRWLPSQLTCNNG